MENIFALAFFILTAVRYGYSFSVQLEKLSTLYLPYDYTRPTPRYGLFGDAAQQLAYDTEGRLLYTAGNNNIHVVDLSDVTNLTLLHHMSFDGVAITDVEYCGGYVFASMDNKADIENGMVKVFRGYNATTDQIELLHNITVGSVPDMLYPTNDCRKLLVAIEAEPYRRLLSESPRDPPGGVAIIKFSDTPAGNYDLKILNFTSFNDQIESLERDGVRFVYRENNTFANDAEPEYIAYNTDETKAYIGLQENNAIAVVDLETEEITHVHGLGFKDWSQSEIDVSNRDGENGGPLINQRPWPVYGMYQPDAIKFLRLGGVDYLLTANEGDSKDYSFFSEEVRGDDITLSSVFEPNATKRAELQDDKNLGRLKITTENGRNTTTGEYDAIYSYGGRSFSIWRADNMSLVYDSGNTIAYQTSVLNPDLFNNNIGLISGAISEMVDSRSDEKGPETESIEIAEFGDYILVIVGNERPGTLCLFSIDKTSSAIEPKFEGMFHDIPRTNASWGTLYNNREISMLDPEDIRYISAENSPNNEPLLVVSGSVSGTITVLQINVAGLPGSDLEYSCYPNGTVEVTNPNPGTYTDVMAVQNQGSSSASKCTVSTSGSTVLITGCSQDLTITVYFSDRVGGNDDVFVGEVHLSYDIQCNDNADSGVHRIVSNQLANTDGIIACLHKSDAIFCVPDSFGNTKEPFTHDTACHILEISLDSSNNYSLEPTTEYSVTPSFTISSALRTGSQTGSEVYSAAVADELWWTIDIPSDYNGQPTCTAYSGSTNSGTPTQTLVSDGCTADLDLVKDNFENIDTGAVPLVKRLWTTLRVFRFYNSRDVYIECSVKLFPSASSSCDLDCGGRKRRSIAMEPAATEMTMVTGQTLHIVTDVEISAASAIGGCVSLISMATIAWLTIMSYL